MAHRGRPEDLGRQLDANIHARLDAGEHDAVARELAAADRHAEAGWVREQIWDFFGATQAYLVAGRLLDAIRTTLEAGDPTSWEATFDALVARREDSALLNEVAALLGRRGRHQDAARVLELADAGPELRARLLAKAGDRLAAAELLAAAGLPRQALDILGSLAGFGLSHPHEHALAAALCWDLGDAEGTAREAQRARRAGAEDGELGRRVRTLLARALSSLGHDLAGQLVLAEGDGEQPERAPSELTGRYRVSATLPAPYAGAAYVGVDRVTLNEVEIHLLLAELGEHERPGSNIREALERFAAAAERADAIAHPAIRPILRLDSEVGLLVMPRREGPVLRNLIRPPGLEQATARARSVIAFMLGALAAAHAVGLVHGSLLPSQIVCDALGRPLLGPFGVHHLSGLVATRTGGLEELLSLTPPERRTGGEPTQPGDIYMIGALWAALLAGRFGADLDELPAAERDDIASMLAADPDARPSAGEALLRLRTPIDDLTVLASQSLGPEDSLRAPVQIDPRLGRSVDVIAAESWSDTELDMLCTARNPWLQNILDREGRLFRLAAWPDGCRTFDAQVAWQSILDPVALELLEWAGEPNAPVTTSSRTLQDAIVSRLDGTAIVQTVAGERMLALDRLLLR